MLPETGKQRDDRRVVIACTVMEPELGRVLREVDAVEIRYLEQGLHRTPQKMAARVQEQIDQAAEYATGIILGYGLCSNGIVGVTARRQGLVVPRCHDCIPLFLGSLCAYGKAFNQRPGTYYLTAGWIRERKDPLSIVEDEYTPRVGRDVAVWAMKEELKHYTHIVQISNGVADCGALRDRAMENALFFGKAYDEVRGSLEYLAKLIRGPYTTEDFFFIAPGESVTQRIFLEEAASSLQRDDLK